MTRKLFFMCATAFLIGTSSVQAADMPLKAPPPLPPPVYSWAGFYIGGNFGGISSHLRFTDEFTGNSLTTGGSSGFMLGGQIGYNWQAGGFVFGVEFDGDWTDLTRRSGVVPFNGFALQAEAKTPGVVTLAARFGYAADRVLFYGKVGGGWVENTLRVTDLNSGASIVATNSNSGLLLGLGLEYAFGFNWTMKFEYDHISLEHWRTATYIGLIGDPISVKREVNMAKFGFNYKM
jgi:opacity protein-like surface antigen